MRRKSIDRSAPETMREREKKRAQAREEKERMKKTTSLAQDAMDARENDMTYGKYMAKSTR